MENWNAELAAEEQILAERKIQSDIFHRNSSTSLLFLKK